VSAKHTWNPGVDCDDAIEIYGKEFVYECVRKTGTRYMQNAIRTIVANGGNQADVTEKLGEDYRPDVSRRPARMTDAERVARTVDKLDEAAISALLGKLKGRLAELQGNGAAE
jgi:hypothetical protein